MAHLTKQDRCKIENFLVAGVKPKEIARNLGKSHTTITREIRRHRQEEEPERRKSRNFCVFRAKCKENGLCQYPPPNCQRKCSSCRIIACNDRCLSFVEDECSKLKRSPFVCNGCGELKNCRRRKYFYFAQEAMKEYRALLVEARRGIDASKTEIQQYMGLIRRGLRQGQSFHHIMASHTDCFQKCERTLYNYFQQGIFELTRGDMPRMNVRKPRTKEKICHRIDPLYRKGRTYADFHVFKKEHPELPTVQMDSVVGSVGGKVLLTLHFECGLMLAWLRDTNNSQSVLDYFDMLEQSFGLVTFRKMFPVILTDNGAEFSNPHAIETSPVTKVTRTRVFFCEPNSAWQKGSIENNHTNLRRILPRGTSFDSLVQDDIDLVISHLNSYKRKLYDDVPAIQRFNSIFGHDILARLNISLIPPEEVILDKKLLGGKI